MKSNGFVLKILCGIGLSTAALLFGGCQRQAPANAVSFLCWGSIEEIGIMNEALAEFHKAYPGIEVRYQRVAAGGPSYDQKLVTLASGNEMPDVMAVSSWYAEKYARFGVLADLTEKAKQSKSLHFEDFYPEINRDFSLEGRVYVVARDIAPVACVYYNRGAFREAGLPEPDGRWTWPEPFLGIAKKLVKKDASGNVLRWGYLDDWGQLYDAFMYSAGGTYFDDDLRPRRLVMDSPQAIEGIRFRADLINRHSVMPSASSMSNAAGIGPSDWFVTGKVAMFYSGSWKIPEFRNIKNFEWDIAPFPRHAGTGRRRIQGGGSGYGIHAGLSPEKFENAWKLVEFLCSPRMQELFSRSGLLQPSNRKVAQGPAFLDGKPPRNKAILIDAIKDVYPSPRTDHFTEILVSVMDPLLDGVWTGKADVAGAVRKGVGKANEKFFPRKP